MMTWVETFSDVMAHLHRPDGLRHRCFMLFGPQLRSLGLVKEGIFTSSRWMRAHNDNWVAA